MAASNPASGMTADQELRWLRRRRQADEATIEALTDALAKLQRAARALKEENLELRREAARHRSPGAGADRSTARVRSRAGRAGTSAR